MTGHDHKTYTWTEACAVVSCSPSTLRRRLNADGARLGATKLKRGWVIPHTTLEALGVLKVVDSPREQSVTGHEQFTTGHGDESETTELRRENTRLRIENATLRAENDGLKRLLAEREKVVALLEESTRPRPDRATGDADGGQSGGVRGTWWRRLLGGSR